MIRLCMRVKCDIPHNYSGIGTCNGMQVVSRARRSRRERLTRETRMQVGCPGQFQEKTCIVTQLY